MEDLFGMFRRMGAGPTKPDEMMRKLLSQYELSILNRLKGIIDDRIRQIKGSVPTGWDELDPFSILGVDIDASEEEVRAAYRRKANEAHPDKGGSNEQMAKVNAAFEAIRRFKGWK